MPLTRRFAIGGAVRRPYMTPARALRRRSASSALGEVGRGMRMPSPSVASWNSFGVHVADDGGVDAGVDHHDVDDGLTESLSFKLQIEDGENGRHVADDRRGVFQRCGLLERVAPALKHRQAFIPDFGARRDEQQFHNDSSYNATIMVKGIFPSSIPGKTADRDSISAKVFGEGGGGGRFGGGAGEPFSEKGSPAPSNSQCPSDSRRRR